MGNLNEFHADQRLMSAQSGNGPDGLSVTSLPSHLKERYARMILVSQSDHMPLLDQLAHDSLVVSTDWLVWRQLVDQGYHALHFESQLQTWTAERGDPDLHFQHSTDWMYVEGRDITCFRGVSLGKTLNWEVAAAAHAYLRLWHSLSKLCRTFQPEEIVLYGVRAEYDFIARKEVLELVEYIANAQGVRLINRMETCPPQDDTLFPETHFARQSPPRSPMNRLLRAALLALMDIAFRLRSSLRSRKDRILVFHNLVTVDGLLSNFRSAAISPVLVADMFPKNLQRITDYWRRGIILTRLPAKRLSAADRAEIESIERRLEAAWETPALGVAWVSRKIARRIIKETNFLGDAALEVRRYESLFSRHGFVRVLVGDSENKFNRIILELARRRKIPSDELLNGMFLSKQRMDARCGDEHGGPLVSRLLSWGLANEKWLEAMGNPIPFARTGYPGLISFLRKTFVARKERQRVLVLPFCVDRIDLRGLYSDIFAKLVETVKALYDMGFPEIRVKVHPGYMNEAYYRKVLRHYGLECDVYKDGPLAPHVEWADIVIGPVNSGAFVETLVANKPYYPMKNIPSSIYSELYAPLTVHGTVESLMAAIDTNHSADRDNALEFFCSFKSIPDAPDRVRTLWETDVA